MNGVCVRLADPMLTFVKEKEVQARVSRHCGSDAPERYPAALYPSRAVLVLRILMVRAPEVPEPGSFLLISQIHFQVGTTSGTHFYTSNFYSSTATTPTRQNDTSPRGRGASQLDQNKLPLAPNQLPPCLALHLLSTSPCRPNCPLLISNETRLITTDKSVRASP